MIKKRSPTNNPTDTYFTIYNKLYTTFIDVYNTKSRPSEYTLFYQKSVSNEQFKQQRKRKQYSKRMFTYFGKNFGKYIDYIRCNFSSVLLIEDKPTSCSLMVFKNNNQPTNICLLYGCFTRSTTLAMKKHTFSVSEISFYLAI